MGNSVEDLSGVFFLFMNTVKTRPEEHREKNETLDYYIYKKKEEE